MITVISSNAHKGTAQLLVGEGRSARTVHAQFACAPYREDGKVVLLGGQQLGVFVAPPRKVLTGVRAGERNGKPFYRGVRQEFVPQTFVVPMSALAPSSTKKQASA